MPRGKKKAPPVKEDLGLPIELMITLSVDKILSENTLYQPTTGRRGSGKLQKHFAYLRLSEEGGAYKQDLESRLDVLITPAQKVALKKLDGKPIRVAVHYKMFVHEKELFTREDFPRLKKKWDVTNMIKGTEDSIFKVLGFDDCNVRVSIAEKIPVYPMNGPVFRPSIQVTMTITDLDAASEMERNPPVGDTFTMKCGGSNLSQT